MGIGQGARLCGFLCLLILIKGCSVADVTGGYVFKPSGIVNIADLQKGAVGRNLYVQYAIEDGVASYSTKGALGGNNRLIDTSTYDDVMNRAIQVQPFKRKIGEEITKYLEKTGTYTKVSSHDDGQSDKLHIELSQPYIFLEAPSGLGQVACLWGMIAVFVPCVDHDTVKVKVTFTPYKGETRTSHFDVRLMRYYANFPSGLLVLPFADNSGEMRQQFASAVAVKALKTTEVNVQPQGGDE